MKTKQLVRVAILALVFVGGVGLWACVFSVPTTAAPTRPSPVLSQPLGGPGAPDPTPPSGEYLLYLPLVLKGYVSPVPTPGPTPPPDARCPALPPPADPTITVATEAELREQALNAAPGTTILVAPGVYDLQDSVAITHDGVTIRGQTGDRDDVILDAGGMLVGHTHAIYLDADDVTVADLTIRNAGEHGVSVQGSDRPTLYNLHIVDTGYQLVKVNPVGDGSDDGLLACSRLEYTTTAPEDYTNGISAHDAHRWTVRDNEWLRIRTPNNAPAPTILFWSGSSDTVVERNLLVDCYQGIAFGNASHGPGDHTGGVVRNNFIYASLPHDSVVEMVHASGWLVAHNTALLLNPAGVDWGMEARFADSQGVFAYNLTNMPLWLDRDGAQATGVDNITDAEASWFVAPSAADLHLLALATAAINQAAPLAEVSDDYDGQARPIGPAPDVGADEYDGTSEPTPTATPTATTPPPDELIQPADLAYQGAFRLPADPNGMGWEWSNWSSALAYFPGGDPDGPDDGYPGSLFGTGHDWNQYVSEVNIPVPLVSPGKDVNDLPTATTLQPFADIRGDLFGEMEMPRVGLATLPAQGAQTGEKLYFAWAPHLDEGATNPSHGWAALDLSNPQPAGPWRVGEYWNYVTGDYLFDIPPDWAGAYASGRLLATGRFRDGGQGAQGPSLFAIAPWAEGNPPPPGATLPATPLLLYGDSYEPGNPAMTGYHHSDEWTGAAWLTAGRKSAVVFAGTKGVGECWYGCADGTDQPPWPDDCDRGWWSTGFVGQFLFYDPADLAAVAQGTLDPWEPQPYATLEVDEVLYHVASSQQKYHLAAAAFDRTQGLLYVLEPLADEDRPLVHVWAVGD